MAVTIVNSSLYPAWEQFSVTGFPNGVLNGTVPRFGKTIELLSADLLALQTTAIQLVSAPLTGGGIMTPPAGFVLFPIRMAAEYVYNSTAYTIANADNAFQIEYTGKTTALLSMLVTGLVDQTASTFADNRATSPGAKIALTNAANLGLEVKLIGTTPALTLGNGVVYLTLDYTAIPMF
jgi:hypothetical protein